jgi:hypothetical protein
VSGSSLAPKNRKVDSSRDEERNGPFELAEPGLKNSTEKKRVQKFGMRELKIEKGHRDETDS